MQSSSTPQAFCASCSVSHHMTDNKFYFFSLTCGRERWPVKIATPPFSALFSSSGLAGSIYPLNYTILYTIRCLTAEERQRKKMRAIFDYVLLYNIIVFLLFYLTIYVCICSATFDRWSSLAGIHCFLLLCSFKVKRRTAPFP